MAKKTKNPNKPFFRKIHFRALLFLVVYTVVSKLVFIKSLTMPDLFREFFGPYIFGVIAGIIFLYLFNHEDFFHFIRDVEKTEKKKEKEYLRKYIHYGKIISTLIIATLGGPIFAALTVRFLLNNVWYKYLLLATGNIGSTFLAVVLAKGLIHII